YVSPRSGRAVSRVAGEAYRDRLMRLPAFLRDADVAPAAAGLAHALALTRVFLYRPVFRPPAGSPPAAPPPFVTALTRALPAYTRLTTSRGANPTQHRAIPTRDRASPTRDHPIPTRKRPTSNDGASPNTDRAGTRPRLDASGSPRAHKRRQCSSQVRLRARAGQGSGRAWPRPVSPGLQSREQPQLRQSQQSTYPWIFPPPSRANRQVRWDTHLS